MIVSPQMAVAPAITLLTILVAGDNVSQFAVVVFLSLGAKIAIDVIDARHRR